MPAEAAAAPLARAASQIDLADHTPADPSAIIRRDNFADELVPRRSAKTVIAALQLEIGIADSAAQQPDQSESFGPARARLVA